MKREDWYSRKINCYENEFLITAVMDQLKDLGFCSDARLPLSLGDCVSLTKYGEYLRWWHDCDLDPELSLKKLFSTTPEDFEGNQSETTLIIDGKEWSESTVKAAIKAYADKL